MKYSSVCCSLHGKCGTRMLHFKTKARRTLHLVLNAASNTKHIATLTREK